MERRHFLAGLAAGMVFAHHGEAQSLSQVSLERYAAFCASIRQEALARGVPSSVLDEAFSLVRYPNPDVLRLDRHQPEFHMSWAGYRDRVINAHRCQQGQQIYQHVKETLGTACRRFGSENAPVMGIWGLESGFGAKQGRFYVIDALATLAFDGRRARFFRNELLNALVILGEGNIPPAQMLGSYAGAMGQVQFMPSAYRHFAADGDGDGRKDIWNSQVDIFSSVANYLGQSGWKTGERWGDEVVVPLGSNGAMVSLASQHSKHAPQRSVEEWVSLGVQRKNGAPFTTPQQSAKLLQPDGAGSQAFLVYDNFQVIRAYNPSDYYALAVGLLGDAITQNGG